MRHCYDCHLQELSEAEVTNPSFESGADLHQGPEQMCVPICTDTRVHTRHTAVSPDLHPVMLASIWKRADGLAGSGQDGHPGEPDLPL